MQKYKINKIKYVNNYNKTHYKQLKLNIKIEEYNKLEKYCESHNISKTQFIRDIINKI